MASITTLTEEQSQQLGGVQVGDLILIESRVKNTEADQSDEGSDNESDVGSEGSDGEEGQEAESIITDGDDQASAPLTNDAEGEMTVERETGIEGEVGGRADDGEHDANSEQYESEANNDEEIAEQQTAVAYSATLYKIHSITKDENETVIDIHLCTLTHCLKPAEANSPIFHIYGADLEHSDITLVTADRISSIKDVMDNETHDNHLYINCSGDDVRYSIFNGRCPAHCNQGWVRTQQEMHDMVAETITAVTEHQPVCPVCMGKDLMQEYQSLREILENTQGGLIDLGMVVEFHGRLNPRRRRIGYRFKQFDEREWGYLFDDVRSEDGDSNDGHGGNTDGWGYWPEALDPASCVVLSPASDAAIESLPRKTYAEVKESDEEVECQVCKDKLADETPVAILPCGHYFCDTGCIEAWLKQWNNCPTCRRKLPSKEDEQRRLNANAMLDSTAEGVNGFEEDGTGQAESGAEMTDETVAVEKDGEDSVMSEPEEAGRTIEW